MAGCHWYQFTGRHCEGPLHTVLNLVCLIVLIIQRKKRKFIEGKGRRFVFWDLNTGFLILLIRSVDIMYWARFLVILSWVCLGMTKLVPVKVGMSRGSLSLSIKCLSSLLASE